jgi:iron-sulfur cluster assembly protein
MSSALFKVTDNAVERIKVLIVQRDKPALGIRIGVKSGGCSGLSYKFEYADEIRPNEEKIDLGEVAVFIEPGAEMYIIGTTLDYVDEKVKSGFVFVNPNEKDRCGCGKSFRV